MEEEPLGAARSADVPHKSNTASSAVGADPLPDPRPTLGSVLRDLKAQKAAISQKGEDDEGQASLCAMD